MKEIEKAIQLDDIETFENLTKGITNFNEANYSITTEDESDSTNNQLPMKNITLLHIAAYYDAIDIFQYLQLTKSVPLRIKSSSSYLPLHYACWSGSVEVTLYILKQDPSESTIKVEGDSNIHILYCAIMGGNTEIMESLFDCGATIEGGVYEQNILIDKAIGLHYVDLLRILFNNIKSQNSNILLPPSMRAILEHCMEAFKLLYKGKSDIIFKASDGTYGNLIDLFCKNDSDRKYKYELLKILDDAKDMDNLEPPKSYENGLVHSACIYLDIDVAKKIIKLPGVNVNRLDSNHLLGPARFRSIKNKDKEIIEILDLLLENGLDLNYRDKDYPSLLELYVITCGRNFVVIEWLLKHNADAQATVVNKNKYGITIYDYVMGLKKGVIQNEQLKLLFEKYCKK